MILTLNVGILVVWYRIARWIHHPYSKGQGGLHRAHQYCSLISSGCSIDKTCFGWRSYGTVKRVGLISRRWKPRCDFIGRLGTFTTSTCRVGKYKKLCRCCIQSLESQVGSIVFIPNTPWWNSFNRRALDLNLPSLYISAEAVEEFKSLESSDQIKAESLSKYTALQQLVQSVTSLCGGPVTPGDVTTETSNIGLVSFLQTVREGTWTQIKAVLSE